nr:hypothetical protein [uncultured Microbulbifer sp.]
MLKEACEGMGVSKSTMASWVRKLRAERAGKAPEGAAITADQLRIQKFKNRVGAGNRLQIIPLGTTGKRQLHDRLLQPNKASPKQCWAATQYGVRKIMECSKFGGQ